MDSNLNKAKSLELATASRSRRTLYAICLRTAVRHMRDISVLALKGVPQHLAKDIWSLLTHTGRVTVDDWMKFYIAYPENVFLSNWQEQLYREEGCYLEDKLAKFIAPNLEWITLLDLSRGQPTVQDILHITKIHNLGALRIGWISTSYELKGMDEKIIRAWAEKVRSAGSLKHLRILDCRFEENSFNKTAAVELASFPALDYVLVSFTWSLTLELIEIENGLWVRNRDKERHLSNVSRAPRVSAVGSHNLESLYKNLTSTSPKYHLLALQFGSPDLQCCAQIFSRQKTANLAMSSANPKLNHPKPTSSSSSLQSRKKARKQIGESLAEFGI